MSHRCGMGAAMVFVFLFCSPISSVFGQTTVSLNADGPGNTYELIDAVFGSGASSETPDNFPTCNLVHTRHIREGFDSTLNENVFLFDVYVDTVIDYDRCSNTDRQRVEIKTVNSNVTAGEGGMLRFQWKFKMDSAFQPSPNFCHLHQIKHTGGDDDGAPLMTITPRHYSDPNQPEWLQLIFTPSTGGSGGGTLDQVELAPLKGIWLDVTEQAVFSDAGKYEVTIKKLDGTVVMHYENYFLDMSRGGPGYHRGKWGIYRSLNSPEYLRDETVKFADFKITSGVVYTVPAAASNVNAAVVNNREIDLSWNDNSDNETNFLIQRSTNGTTWSSIGSASANQTTFVDNGLEDSTTYYYRVRAENWNVASSFSDSVKVTTLGASKTLNASWFDKDIGYTSPHGYAGLDSANGTLVIQGSGKDIWSTSDEFHFVYQNLSGNGMITARVDSVERSSEWAKAGVMIRATLDAASQHAINVVTPEHGVSFQYRSETGGSSSSVPGDTVTAPYWVRLVRHGNTIVGLQSADGLGWDTVSSTVISMPVSVYAGYVVTSHNSGVICSSLFSNLSVTNDASGGDYIWIEAESADSLSAPAKVVRSYDASAGNYIVTEVGKNTTSAPSDGHAVYHFNVSASGTFKLWGRVLYSTTSYNSFWFKVDNNDWVPWNDDSLITSNWIWGACSDYANSNAVVTYPLSAGVHSLTFTYREPGAFLDKILITNDMSFNPNPENTTGVIVRQGNNPDGYILNNSYPNPFNPSTTISYSIPAAGDVQLAVYDIIGREVSAIVDQFQKAGQYKYIWNAEDSFGRSLSGGIYFARLRAGEYVKTIKLILLK